MMVTPDMMVATAEWNAASDQATRAALDSAAEISVAAGTAATHIRSRENPPTHC